MPSAHLLIIGDRAALSRLATEQRMAFPAGRAKAARALGEGDEVLLCATRGCFGNPTRDLGRIVGRATIASPVRVLNEPVVFNERSYSEGCHLKVSGLTPFREGLVLRDSVPRLSVFPAPATWSVRTRRASLTLPPTDAEPVRTELEPLLRPYGETCEGYRWEPAAAHPSARSTVFFRVT